MVPDRQWISCLMSQREVPRHIVLHSLTVRMVAVTIAYALCDKGFNIDMKVVDRASLLHDICKTDSLKHGGDHALMGRELLEGCGYPLIGDVIGQHIRLRSMDVDEAMVVNYADKRVMHDRVVSLEKRFVDLMDRYGRDERSMQAILMHHAHTREIEETLVRASGIYPEWFENLNLISGDHPFDGEEGFFCQHGAVEKQNHHVNLEGIDKDEPV